MVLSHLVNLSSALNTGFNLQTGGTARVRVARATATRAAPSSMAATSRTPLSPSRRSASIRSVAAPTTPSVPTSKPSSTGFSPPSQPRERSTTTFSSSRSSHRPQLRPAHDTRTGTAPVLASRAELSQRWWSASGRCARRPTGGRSRPQVARRRDVFWLRARAGTGPMRFGGEPMRLGGAGRPARVSSFTRVRRTSRARESRARRTPLDRRSQYGQARFADAVDDAASRPVGPPELDGAEGVAVDGDEGEVR
jgi:hypothetical protein